MFLSVMCHSYEEEQLPDGQTRTVLLACALTGFCAPAALAEYNIAAPSKDYTAVDKVTVTGKAIKASQIPAGRYHITASTSSSNVNGRNFS